jgi:hypothetical protein
MKGLQVKGLSLFHVKRVPNAAGVHSRSVGKIERGLTRKLSHKTLSGLALALSVPVEYLQAVVRGEEVVANSSFYLYPG